MTSTAIGLPDRYRTLEQSGPDERTETGVIRSWRAKDRILNRDVAIRVHTPGGPAAHAWITRALTAGGLATPALAMVYDAAEGSTAPDGSAGAAYVVNEWIDGESLVERLQRGPLSDREARTVLRRLAEGVAEAHRVGLAVGGLSPENVVLRPNGLVGLRGVPAATGTIEGDIAALGALLEACLTGFGHPAPGSRRPAVAPDLAALVRRARSTEPGQGLSSAAAMATLLAEWPRSGANQPAGHGAAPGTVSAGSAPSDSSASGSSASGSSASGRADQRGESGRSGPRRLLGRRPVPPPAQSAPPAPASPPAAAAQSAPPAQSAPATQSAPAAAAAPVTLPAAPLPQHVLAPGSIGEPPPPPAASGLAGGPRRRALVVALPVLALAVVIGLGAWLGSSVLSVAGSVAEVHGSTPSAAAPSSAKAADSSQSAAIRIGSAKVFDPYGDGSPENDKDVPQSYDGNPVTSWSTLQYRGSARFGNLKPGVGVLYDLGSAQTLSGVTLSSVTPGATVEVRTGSTGDGKLADYAVQGSTRLGATSTVTFAKPVTARYVLVWITGLVQGNGGYSADLAEVSPVRAR